MQDRAIRVADQLITIPYVQKEQPHVHPYSVGGMPDCRPRWVATRRKWEGFVYDPRKRLAEEALRLAELAEPMIDAELERHAERASFAYGSVPRWVLPDAQLTLNIPSTEGTQASCHTSLSNRRAPKPLGARLVRIRPRGRRTSGTFPARGLGSSVDQIRCRSIVASHRF